MLFKRVSKSTFPLICFANCLDCSCMFTTPYIFFPTRKQSIFITFHDIFSFASQKKFNRNINTFFYIIIYILVKVYNVNLKQSGKYHITIHIHFIIRVSSSIKNVIVIFLMKFCILNRKYMGLMQNSECKRVYVCTRESSQSR